MALDEVLTHEVAAGRHGPTLRVWEWDRPAIIIGSFQSLSNEVDMDAAHELGVDVVRRISGVGAMFVEPGNTITSDGGKIAGAAQKRLNGAVLHHVTMAYDIDAERMTRVLRIGREKLSDKGIASAGKRGDPLRRQTGQAIIRRMAASFGARFTLKSDGVRPEEPSAAQTLAETKFQGAAWLARVP